MEAIFEWFGSDQGKVVIALLIPFVASIMNIFVSSDSSLGKVVNAAALAFGKASVDPKKQ